MVLLMTIMFLLTHHFYDRNQSMTNDSGDHIIALVVNMQLYHSRPKACAFQSNFNNAGDEIIASIIIIQF